MQIVQMAVSGFRCVGGGLEKNAIKFKDNNSTFIFGQNNVGKSSFLKAYEVYYNAKVIPDDFTYVAEGVPPPNLEVELWFSVDDTTDKTNIETKSPGKYNSLTSYLQDGILKVKRTSSKPANSAAITTTNWTYNPSTEVWDEKNYGGIGLDGVFQSLIPKPLFIKAMPTEEEVKNIVNDILKEIANTKLTKEESEALANARATITSLQDKVYDKATIDDYETQVNTMFTDLFDSYRLKIDDGTSRLKYTHDKLGKDFEIDFIHNDTNTSTKYTNMGHGAVRMAIFLLMLMRDKLEELEERSEKSYIVLFEEPELFLHPKLTKKLRQLVYEVSASNTPFQILCASHSPQMIDLSQDHSSIVRMVKDDIGTQLHQVLNEDLINVDATTLPEVKQKIHEILRFNPFVCESFYADEVILVEGDTEAIIWRGYLQEFPSTKDIFVVNCGTINNIPFYQKIFSKFSITYSVICDTDHDQGGRLADFWDGKFENPTFTGFIQKSISDQFDIDNTAGKGKRFFVNAPTFEPMHESLPEPFKYVKTAGGKAVNANSYWEKLVINKEDDNFKSVPIIDYIERILN